MLELDSFLNSADVPGDTPAPAIVEDYLNSMEQQGWRLLSVVPDIRRWDANGEPDGKTGAMLVLHRDGS
ncbi:hypothetical protein QI633_08180 [Nocardioides sp. QY071]|uniref:hypothetical protein n=1 Tax=Nocardioides sp. QY071 TaxID=3044187 RepID=UPI00249C53B2|nr:hypothetical protein [Nocardioides sp. QY071]WGY03730.1 hypothetical protein QI633_08180 [Nocardioides sp. QY071]